MKSTSLPIRFFIISIACVVLIVLIYKIYQAFLENRKAFEEDLTSVYTLSQEDSSLINKNFKTRIKVIEVRRSKVRNPISIILVDSEYYLIMHKMSLSRDLSLREIAHIQQKSVDHSTGVTYDVIENGDYFRFQHASGRVETISQIYLTLSGDSLMTFVNNDTRLDYFLLCNNLSIRYCKRGPIDIFLEGKQMGFNNMVIPLDFLLLKRDKDIFFFFMMPITPEKPMPTNLLSEVIVDI